MHQQSFSPRNLTPLKGLLLLLFILAISFASRSQAAVRAGGEYQTFLPIITIPEEPEAPTIGYATGTDRTLIRWFCTANCNTQFEVYRRAAGGAAIHLELGVAVGRAEPADEGAVCARGVADGGRFRFFGDGNDGQEGLVFPTGAHSRL